MRNYQTSFITVFSLNKQMKRKKKKKVDNDEICRFLAVVQFDLFCFGFNCAGNLICNTTGGINCSECPHGYYPTGSNIENQTKCSNFRKALNIWQKISGQIYCYRYLYPFLFCFMFGLLCFNQLHFEITMIRMFCEYCTPIAWLDILLCSYSL